MATKSVIEIDVLDEKFKAFQVSFEKYKKSLDGQSKSWKEINKYIAEAEKRQKDFNKAMGNGISALKGAVGITSSIASNMASAALSAAKWVTYGALGGGFGLGALASSATSYRTQSRIAGISSGQLRSIETYLEPSVPGAKAILGTLENIRTDKLEQYRLGSIGGPALSSFKLLANVLEKAGESFKKTGSTNEFLWRNPTLENVISPEDIRAFGGLSKQEQGGVLKRLRSGQFETPDRTEEVWQRFWEQLKAAGHFIETSFLNNLEKVAGAFTELSKAIAQAIDKFLKNEQVQEFLTKTLPDAIKTFVDYLTSPQFKTDLDDFFSALKQITEWIISVLRSVGIVSEKQYQTTPEDVSAAGGNQKKADWINAKRREAIEYWTSHGATQNEAIGLAANFEAESTWNSSAKNVDKKGRLHYGMAQLDPERQADFLAWKGHSIQTSKDEEQYEFALYELTHKKKHVLDEMRAKNNRGYGEDTYLLAKKFEIFGDDPKEYQRRFDIANRIAVDLHVTRDPNADYSVVARTLSGKP